MKKEVSKPNTFLIDTNIIVDFLIIRNKISHEEAKKVFEDIKRGSFQVILLHWVLMEVIFVLKKYYHLEIKQILESCITLLSEKNIYHPQKKLLIESLKLSYKHNTALVDSLLINYSKKHSLPVLTFDKKLLKLSQWSSKK